MDPITILAGGALGLSLLGGLGQAKGQQQQYTAQADAAAYQATVANKNSAVAEEYAKSEEQRGQVEFENTKIAGKQIISAQKAGQGASGLDVGSGSPLRVRQSQAVLNELDAATVLSNAAKRAYGFRTQGEDFAATAGLLRMQEDSTRKAGKTAVGNTLLSTVGNMGTKILGFNQVGVKGFSF